MTWVAGLIGLVVLFLALALGVQTCHVSSLKDEIDANSASFAAQIASAQAAALKQTQAYRAQKQAWQEAQQKAANEAAVKVTQAHTDAVAAGTAADRLRARFAASLAAACGPTSHPAPSGVSQATPPIGMYTDVLGSVGIEAKRYAVDADAALNSGEQCQAVYPVSLKPD